MTPKQIVSELDRYIIGQFQAKKGGGYRVAQQISSQ